jgi:hypothetical protein
MIYPFFAAEYSLIVEAAVPFEVVVASAGTGALPLLQAITDPNSRKDKTENNFFISVP